MKVKLLDTFKKIIFAKNHTSRINQRSNSLKETEIILDTCKKHKLQNEMFLQRKVKLPVNKVKVKLLEIFRKNTNLKVKVSKDFLKKI